MALSRRPKSIKHKAAEEVAAAIQETHRYTFKMDKALWREVKKKAVDEDIAVSDLLNEYLRGWVKS